MQDALVVDDEPFIAQLCVMLLARLGLRARAVGTVRAAIDVLTDAAEPLALLCVDIGLPDGSGLDVVSEARRLRPTLPIVIATGSSAHLPESDAVVLRKPFTTASFAAVVAEAMRGATAAAG